MTDYEDYFDAAAKDGEPVIQGEHGGCIYRLAPRTQADWVVRDRFERRDERTQQFFDDLDRRHGPRRFEEVESARVADIECGGTGRVSVADRNPALHPVLAGICDGFAL